ncbi:endoplasmic reticulum membrane sensor NFE2L1-like isoform X1 [Lytechinus variegatus]|uniref:endoplasmic reticulum membrane sensor NFE2L1-like isoform X1 n=1 Tax=Lytechinus variegatus TaxID=7654 RepID=UPI001BB1E797|nr:endoplasmic reticulum membrane sensor NFE2L1-like isoform X1 [Lytechinus variegatus]XP_041476325.1 endoplasmic reticulum membrane sensor NFE2L1-like isoform X1 [Lytechinus variegatus]
MIRKKLPYESVLAIALMLSVLRIDWTDYLREDILVTSSGFSDTILGPSVGLTETQFHNLYNSVGQTHSTKDIIRDSFYYDRSVFRELDSLYEGVSSVSSSRRRVEVTTFLLDQLESNDRSNGQLMVAQQPTNPTNGNVNININSGNLEQPMHHDSDSDEGFEEMDTGLEGAVGQSHSVSPTPSDELSIEDMDLIESLWRQDIDMGVCPDTYPYKADLKPGFTDDLKKQGLDLWDYSIDGETGEYVPGPQQDFEEVQRTDQPQVPVPHPPTPQDTQPPQESSLSLEDCLQLLEDEYSPDTAQSELSPGLSQQETEQRWHDLATIPELQGSIPELLPTPNLNNTQEGYSTQQPLFIPPVANVTGSLVPEVTELSQPQLLNDVFAVNASTNGMVSLQNATQSQQQPILLPPTRNDSFNNFPNVDAQSHSTNATASAPSNNMTDYLMQTLQMNAVNASAPFPAANLSTAENSSSLLMDLLNSPSSAHPINPLDLDFDEQMQDVIAALGEDSESLTNDEDSDGSIFEGEGATGYSSSSDQDSFKGATGGYGFSRGHERQYGSDSSSNSYSSQPPKMENVKHNHSYAAPSQSQMQNGNGAQNMSHNGTNGSSKLNRDEKRAKALKLPLCIEKIINLPVDSFNDLIKKYELTDPQMQLVRDIRRRGKNKVAAQNCRKRKIDAIQFVESTVGELRMERDKLVKERDNIDKEVSEMQQRYAELCEEVFSSVQDEHGSPVDPNDYTLQQMPDGTVYLIPRNSNQRDRDEQSM